MQDTPIRQDPTSHADDYDAGYARVMRFYEHAKMRGWRLTERQIVHEIIQRERAALIREKCAIPVLGQDSRSAAWNRGQADALRTIMQTQRKTAE